MKKVYTAGISKSGKVYIPKEVRKILGSDRITFKFVDNKIKIVPVKSVACRLG